MDKVKEGMLYQWCPRFIYQVNDNERTPYLFASVRVYHKPTDVKAVH